MTSKPSKDLLHSLESKLKTANIRSPYLRASIGRSRNRIDLTSFDLLTEEQSLVSDFFDQLTNSESNGCVSLVLKITPKNVAGKTEEERVKMDTLMKRLQNIHFDQQDDFAEHGTKSFGFGYPLLGINAKSDKNRTLLAPLFIWSLEIQPAPNNHHVYEITRKETHPIAINPQLKAFLASEYGLTLEKIPDDFFDDGCLNQEQLTALVNDISQLVGAQVVDETTHFSSIQALDFYARQITETPLIYNSGIFTLFKSNKESIVDDYTKMISGLDDMLFDDPNLYQPYQADYFTSTPLDPSQEGILRNISNHKKVIIQGPPGTGKSNSLTGIILNALENQATTLVVCEKKTALEVIADNLNEKGLSSLCAVIDNITSDRQKIVKALREQFDQREYLKESSVSLDAYENVKREYTRFYDLMQSKYGNLLTKIVGNLSWKDCIGNYLHAKRVSNNSEELPIKQFDASFFSDEEFYATLKKLKDAAYLYESIADIAHAFAFLNDNLFTAKESTRHIQQLLEYLEGIDASDYASWKSFSDSDLIRFSAPSFGLKLKSLFNKQLKENMVKVKQLKERAVSPQQDLNKICSMPVVSSMSINDIRTTFIQNYELLQKALSFKSYLRDYYRWRYFKLNELSEEQLILLSALEEHYSINDWENGYRKWFFNEVLLLKEMDLGDFPTSDRELNAIIGFDQLVIAQQKESIIQKWHEIQKNKTAGRTLQELRLIFNLRSNKSFGRRNSLRKLMYEEFDLISAFFPVILVNPSVCSSIFPLKQGLFDVVIFDEASQLRLEDTYPALLRGRFQIVSGDIHQMPPATHFGTHAENTTSDIEELEDDVVFAEEESLLTYAQNSDFEFNYLDFHYRSQHPYLIDFSNAAFYGKRLVPMPPLLAQTPIQLIEVSGQYEDNKNEKEADTIIDLLFNKIKPNDQGVYPSIGIATFNMTQQRFIWEKIWEYVDKDSSARETLAALEAAGLFVKNLENIQGDQRDIVIISTTFGVRPDGRFIQNFGPINRDKGYKLLNVIVTRAKQKIYLVSSIPAEHYTNFRSDLITKGNTGKGIFYAYLMYAKMCSENNEAGRKELLRFLLDNSGETIEDKSETKDTSNSLLTESVFEEEVIQELLQFTHATAIQTQFELGGFRLDIVVKDKTGAPVVVIECDGKTYHSSKVAYRYDIHRQKILERHGLKVYRIWSTNWWRNKDREVKLLKAYLKENVKEAIKTLQ